jgi:UDP-glucuronate decarboxylase
MRTILVTGGAGFLGSHLCKSLLERNGNKVICLDNFFTGQIDNLRDLEGNPNFKIVSHDITDPLIGKISEHVDEIYNLACPASPIHYQFDPIETIKANTLGVVNVLEFARVNGAKILQASTSEIYGDPEVHPQVESYRGNVNTIGPRACYDEGKRVAETLFMDYHRKYNLDIRIVRIFNTYGPNMARNDGRVVSNFIIQALKNEPITIYGDGNQTRSFCYVSDLVEGLCNTMSSDEIMPINLGNPDEFTIKELAEKVVELIGSSSEIVYHELPVDDPRQRKPNIDRANSVLNWSPKIKLDEGLKKTISYFKN